MEIKFSALKGEIIFDPSQFKTKIKEIEGQLDSIRARVFFKNIGIIQLFLIVVLNTASCTLSTHENRLSFKEKRSTAELVGKRAKELYGLNLKERSDENLAWMLRNGFLKRKKIRPRARAP